MPTVTPVDSQRTPISIEEARQLRELNLLVDESHRARPRYFDGKFLAARDLTRDQAYFLSRQAGFARGLGTGVVEGLQVQMGDAASDIVVSPGFGYTSTGELVALRTKVHRSLAVLFQTQTLAAQLGTLSQLHPPLHNRTGIFVLGLRALEFSANPVAAYPTSLDGPRQVEEGDIVEASALTLSYLADAPADRIESMRSQLARDAFISQSLPALPAEVLPLAIVALSGDNVRWVDMHLVRRMAGQAHADVLGFGFAPRMLREAHLAQYSQQLQEVMARTLAGQPTASQYFSALPGAGPMPAAAVDSRSFTQSWFPPGVQADLALVPEDEIGALVEESLLLPPIDLSLETEALQSTAVAILVPVARHALDNTTRQLQQQIERATVPLSPRLAIKQSPLNALLAFEARRLLQPAPPVLPQAPGGADAVWAALLAAQRQLWYVRRRNLAVRPEYHGEVVAVIGAEADTDQPDGRPVPAAMRSRASKVLDNATIMARADLVRLLAAEKFKSPLLAQAVLAALEGKRSVTRADVAAVAQTFNAPGVGTGLAKLALERPDLLQNPAVVGKLAESDRLLDLDRALAHADRFETTRIAGELKISARGKSNIDRVVPGR